MSKQKEIEAMERSVRSKKGKLTKKTLSKAKKIIERNKAENAAANRSRTKSSINSSQAKTQAAINRELLEKYSR